MSEGRPTTPPTRRRRLLISSLLVLLGTAIGGGAGYAVGYGMGRTKMDAEYQRMLTSNVEKRQQTKRREPIRASYDEFSKSVQDLKNFEVESKYGLADVWHNIGDDEIYPGTYWVYNGEFTDPDGKKWPKAYVCFAGGKVFWVKFDPKSIEHTIP